MKVKSDEGCDHHINIKAEIEHPTMEESFGKIRISQPGTYNYQGHLIEILPTEVDKWIDPTLKILLSSMANSKFIIHMIRTLGPERLYQKTLYEVLQVIQSGKKVILFFDVEEYAGILACKFGSEVRHITKKKILIEELSEL